MEELENYISAMKESINSLDVDELSTEEKIKTIKLICIGFLFDIESFYSNNNQRDSLLTDIKENIVLLHKRVTNIENILTS